MYSPIQEEAANTSNWGNMSKAKTKEKFGKLAKMPQKYGPHERYIKPLYKVQHAILAGFCLLDPSLDHWVCVKG